MVKHYIFSGRVWGLNDPFNALTDELRIFPNKIWEYHTTAFNQKQAVAKLMCYFKLENPEFQYSRLDYNKFYTQVQELIDSENKNSTKFNPSLPEQEEEQLSFL